MIQSRLKFTYIIMLLGIFAVLVRLLHWQLFSADELSAIGRSQYLKQVEMPAPRGEIFSNDGFTLVTNTEKYLIYSYLPQLSLAASQVAEQLAGIFPLGDNSHISSNSADSNEIDLRNSISAFEKQLTRQDVYWVPLVRNVSREKSKEVEELQIEGIGREPTFIREYPEASMAAHLLGFVGSDTAGNPKGYFGLEGYYDLELKGRSGILRQENDATGRPILMGKFDILEPKKGRDLILNLDRAVQRITEKKLEEGLIKYGAKSGEVLIMHPKTGAVLSMSSLPSYEPANFDNYDAHLYKNSIIAQAYEPGSTFKVLIMAAALDAKAVTPTTRCDICEKPVKIGAYTIRTWNDEYRPQINMREVIQYSDNVGMVFVASKLGKEKLYDYLLRFGIGEKTGVDLEDELIPPLRDLEKWKDIDLATASFGQGVAVTGLQMVKAVAAIANNGVIVTPRIVRQVIGDQTSEIQVQEERRVISKEAARLMTEMMVNAVENGEAKWAKPKGYKIAGKTGTAQIPVAGHYDEGKTIASFIGFAPVPDPKFIMLVKLREPITSPWGSETAAPLWFSIAEDLLYYYGVQPQKE